MSTLRILIVLLTFSSTLTWANQIYSVSILSNFTATQPCVTNCTETVAASFEYTWNPADPNPASMASVVPGTLWLSANGFLGSASGFCCDVKNGYYVPILDVGGDEIDITSIGYGLEGSNIAYMQLWSCRSQACISAYNPPTYQEVGGFFMNQTYGSSVISRVPEPSSFVLLVPGVALVGWKFRNSRTSRNRRF